MPLAYLARSRVPAIVVQFHGGWSDRLVAPGRRLFKLASAFLQACSTGLLLLSTEECEYWRRFRPAGRYRTVSNPLVPGGPAPRFDPAFKCARGEPTLLFVGRLIPQKGAMELLEAAARIDRWRCRVWIVGAGPSLSALEARAAQLGIAERVRFWGYLQGDALLETYRRADVFVLPTYWAEGFATVITEAMSMGLPVVTTRCRGMADELREGIHALFVPPRDPGELAAAIARVLGDAELRRRMYAANVRKVAEFAADPVAARYLSALASIAGWGTMAAAERDLSPMPPAAHAPAGDVRQS